MFVLVLLLVLLVLPASSDDRAGYVVTLRAPEPTLTYKSRHLGPGGMASSSFHRPDYAVSEESYGLHLESLHRQVLSEVMISDSNMYYSYKRVLNGFAAGLTLEEVERLRQHPAVGNVFKSRLLKYHTTHTPAFLQLGSSLWKDVGGIDEAGEDIIIGIIDSGVWPEYPSFKDEVEKYGPPPRKWKGICNTTSDFPASSCNNKLIGATFFYQGVFRFASFPDLSLDYLSPRDVIGHGTYIASTAGGNKGVDVIVRNHSYGVASGMAPRARIATYKVGFYTSGEYDYVISTDDTVMAIEQAVDDGVDIINYSAGSEQEDFLFDPVELAFLLASHAGVFIAAAAGNSGEPNASLPFYGVVSHPAPWLTAVAASSHDRKYEVEAILGNERKFSGASLVGASLMAPLITSTAASLPGLGENATFCFPNSLDAKKAKGKIVVCSHQLVGNLAPADKSRGLFPLLVA
eukprot:TRINITY_DN3154_c0_g2_i1.p1 TRINITY_DN3154_c0_g2~~TRINITY_DN3154_c0_g2_i1.p1  ORF type:complete len:461 (-),score=59.90 TRINITY_DN3154_c0_g2_i1:1087-2469(-)